MGARLDTRCNMGICESSNHNDETICELYKDPKHNETIDKLWNTYDVDKNNYVDEKEAVAMMTDFLKAELIAQDKAIAIMKKIETDAGTGLCVVKCKMNAADADGDGKLSKQEFKICLTRVLADNATVLAGALKTWSSPPPFA